MRKCNAISLVTGSEYSDLGRVIQDSGNGVVHWTPIQINPATGSSSAMVTIDGDVTFSPNRPALILFSSGTTGVPKAILHSRQMLWPRDSPLDSADVVLLYFPLHWAGGVVELLGAMSVGACVETFRFKMGSYADIWERLRHGRITAFRGAPFFWNGLKNFFEKNLRLQPQEELQPYIQAVQQLRHVSFSGGMPSPSLKRFWVDLRGGRSFHLGYGSTELGGPGLRIDLSKEDDLSKVCH
jgi:malonyl-CoA/methylmalonyl-CoA synthetase